MNGSRFEASDPLAANQFGLAPSAGPEPDFQDIKGDFTCPGCAFYIQVNGTGRECFVRIVGCKKRMHFGKRPRLLSS
jgi:hypothetical protein